MDAGPLAVTIHASPSIAWHPAFASRMSEGLKVLGIPHRISGSRERESDVAILLGTTCWRSIESSGKYLLVDRASFRDPEFVSLVWNGHGRRGDHKVPDNYDESRWDLHGVQLMKWKTGRRTVLCGQTETWSPQWRCLGDWYKTHPEATHFRKHPAGEAWKLPLADTFADCGRVVTLNSSVAIEALILGHKTTVDDAGGMAYGWDRDHGGRGQFFDWLAWTQWHHDEIAAGEPIRHLFN